MSSLRRAALFWVFFLLFYVTGYSQDKIDTTQLGEVHGLVIDSTHNYVLPQASVAIYKAKDSTLINYQLTNAYGEFQFKKIPIRMELRVIVSYVGYKNLRKNFSIAQNLRDFDLKTLVMEKNSIELKEVVVKYVPPVRMNHDTLEFNADAFNLDKNAVVEDLLRKLPRLTVWGDGSITVNGKQVKQVLVNGKPFFGGNVRVAIQNIPKNAVDKIQVYKELQAKNNQADSITSVNIKLKKDKAFGLFGKISAGYGTRARYETDANINIFNKKTQISLVGAGNNVNKTPDDANTLLRNSTYKGTGASIEYQPDFTLTGVNHSKSGGGILQHDFVANTTYNNTSRLTADYFIKKSLNTTNTDLRTTSTLLPDSTQTQKINGEDKIDNTIQQMKARYERRKRFFTITAGADLRITDNHAVHTSLTSLYGGSGALRSTNQSNTESGTTEQNLSVDVNVSTEKDYKKINRLPGDWNVDYTFNSGNSQSNLSNATQFSVSDDAVRNQKFNRQYSSNNNNAGHHLTLGLGDFSGLFFGSKGFMGISISLKNTLDFTIHKENNLVRNKDSLGVYREDPYLTNTNRLTIYNEQPALVLRKAFLRQLANRYKKFATLDFTLQEQFYNQHNSSTHSFQNFEGNYMHFVPKATFNYSNDQYGDFSDDFSLSFSTVANYPTVNQLRPIVDSINQYYILLGNPNLREATEHRLSFKMEHSSERTKNTFTYSAEISSGIISNSFADSSITDGNGKSRHYTVNGTAKRYVNISGSLNKAFKFNEHQLQIQFLPAFSFSRAPVYINNVLNISNTILHNISLNIFYTLNDWWAFNIKETVSIYNSRQSSADDIKFKSTTISTLFATTINCTKRLSMGSNATYNRFAGTGSGASGFTIWNANAVYRMLRGNNLELKLAALDLLHQNTGIFIQGSNNVITRGTTNVLRQYFMATLAFYPRQFGLKEKHKVDGNE